MMMEVSRPPEYASTTFSRMVAPCRRGAHAAAQKQQQDRLLDMHPVFRLVEDDRPWRINNPGGHFLAAMGGQAVHKNPTRRRTGEQLLVDLVGRKNPCPPSRFVFLPHAGPHVSIDGVC